MANTTASASGVKRYLAAPVSITTGTKTMQIESVETKVGTAICCAPSRMALTIGFFCARLRWIFSISTVASSTRMPTARAMPPKVMMLIVLSRRLRTIIEVKIESGMEMQTMSVLRQLPMKSRIISAVRSAAMRASRTTPPMAARTKSDWSKSWVTFSSEGKPARMRGSTALTRLTMDKVDASPFFSTVSSAPRRPSWRTMLVCTAKPSRTCATSLM